MWPLFVGIGVGFLLLLAYGWGVAVGVRVTKRAQTREQEALRVLGQVALRAHEREGEAWRRALQGLAADARAAEPSASAADTRASTPSLDTAELAHAHTRSALLDLRPAWGEYDLGDETSANVGKPELNASR